MDLVIKAFLCVLRSSNFVHIIYSSKNRFLLVLIWCNTMSDSVTDRWVTFFRRDNLNRLGIIIWRVKSSSSDTNWIFLLLVIWKESILIGSFSLSILSLFLFGNSILISSLWSFLHEFLLLSTPTTLFVSLSEPRINITMFLSRFGIIKTTFKSLNFLRKLIFLMSLINLTFNFIQHLTILQLNFFNFLLQRLKLFLQILYLIRIYWWDTTMWFRRWTFIRLMNKYITRWWFEYWFMDWHVFFYMSL